MFSSRAGAKLAFALDHFKLNMSGLVCADLGCSTGGFTSCLLQGGAAKVYAVDTGYGVLDYKLRIDPRVVVMERTNAMHVTIPEPLDFVSVDVSWTPQRLILPHAISLLKPSGLLISLLKPHYEAKIAQLSTDQALSITEHTISDLTKINIVVSDFITSPVLGEKGGNTEYLLLIKP